ncbi:unnamed protein product [Polarella glacialis]|uniref:Methyltransferase type 11 domain-containing protein n=1 Tax=Polarella glacialis TaxID=89957 RepID=A0A813GW64_POLGL|nr:unnamed protein product [Polarella glacialis]
MAAGFAPSRPWARSRRRRAFAAGKTALAAAILTATATATAVVVNSITRVESAVTRWPELHDRGLRSRGRPPAPAKLRPFAPCRCGLCAARAVEGGKAGGSSESRRAYFAATFGVLWVGGLWAAGQAVSSLGWDRQLFVQQMQGMADYEQVVAPRKAELFQAALGDRGVGKRIVEVGVGRRSCRTGTNFGYLRQAGASEVIAVEPNQYFVPVATAAARAAGLRLEVKEGTMEALPFATSSVDVLVGTLVLCSVADVARALAEARRVLRPGGRYIFTEHVAAPQGSWLRTAQDIMDPVQQSIAAGCHLVREPLPAITDVFGASCVTSSRWELEGASGQLPNHLLLAPHISGFAEVKM